MAEPEANTRPKNAIVILLDSLNRHLLGAYGGSEFDTPNIDRFAARSRRFDRHYAGLASVYASATRHPVWRPRLPLAPMGSIEIWEEAITYHVRKKGVVMAVEPPDLAGRLALLKIHSRRRPLA